MSDPAVIVPAGGGRRSQALLRSLLGKALRRTRLKQGRTLAEVAGAARISMPYLSEVERGRKEASSEILAAVCDALGIELSDLLADVVRELSLGSTVRSAATCRRWGGTPPASGPGDLVYRLAA
jgi:transcriptional regulator with XRE-family HTH domain